MFQNGQKVVVVSGGDPTRVVRVQEATGTDTARYPTVTTDGVVGRDQQVQIVTGYDESRAPYLIGVNSFSPLDLSPAAWYKFNTGITEAGGFVSAWADQSGNSRHLAQGTGTNQPAVSAGIITGDGADNYLKVTGGFTLNQPIHIFAVLRQDSWTANDRIFDGNTATAFAYQNGLSPNISIYAGTTVVNTNPDIAVGAWTVMQGFFSGASSFVKVDGNAAVTGNAGASNMGGFTLFASGGNTQWSNVSVKEIVICSAEVTGANLTNLYDYLAAVRDA